MEFWLGVACGLAAIPILTVVGLALFTVRNRKE